MVKVGIYGASGYTGQELLRLLISHPEADVVAVTSRRFKDTPVSEVYPAFAGMTDLGFVDSTPRQIAPSCDVVFLAVPHGEAMAAAPVFLEAGVKVIDLSADFRLRDVSVYESWYVKHTAPDLIKKAVYGLPELYRDDVKGADLVANPGCYPTSIILGIAPLLKEGCVDPLSIIADSKSGTSGAGRDLKIGSLFCEVNEGIQGLQGRVAPAHPWIEQELGRLAKRDLAISFTPSPFAGQPGNPEHHIRDPRKKISTAEVIDIYRKFLRRREVRARMRGGEASQNISSVRGTNFCDIGCVADGRTGRAIIVSAIDNLVKGASGQAVQNMNLMRGLPEDAGLDQMSVFP